MVESKSGRTKREGEDEVGGERLVGSPHRCPLLRGGARK